MQGALIDISGDTFIDCYGRQVILRGVNLGGDCKSPYPDGGTYLPGDFADHRMANFVGRPFPLGEADTHLARIAGWGFNCLRLLVTWEAIEHAGPGSYDQDYLDYIAEVARRAHLHGFVVFVDFHQDVWSRMTGGDGAPGWLFEKLGLDYTKFDAAGAAHVMQYRYDYANAEARQEHLYPMMSWARNYRLPANGILWTAFFAGALLTPDWQIDGVNVQRYLQDHYLGAMAALARRLADNPAVIGFDSLNEPSLGFIGQSMSQPQLAASRESPIPVRAGSCWTPFTALRAAHGEAVEIPVLAQGESGMRVAGSEIANPGAVSIWLPRIVDPFQQAGAWRLTDDGAEVLDENFFRSMDGRVIDPDGELMLPFFHEVADTIRSVRPEWILFAEMNPYQFGHGRGFPHGMPARSVNASHWYDVDILWRKVFDQSAGKQQLRSRYRAELAQIHAAGNLPNAPKLVGEFGIPFDLDKGRAFTRWAAGERDEAPWDAHATALGLMYDALDALQLSSTQWNYTASNRNDPRIGDGWNQEDLSIFSPDQLENGDGARGRKGFSRPYVMHAQGRISAMRFDDEGGRFDASIDADPIIAAPTEIFIPKAHFPDGIAVTIEPSECHWRFDPADRKLRIEAKTKGRIAITVEARPAADATADLDFRRERA